jgi:nicotinamide riboside kinase
MTKPRIGISGAQGTGKTTLANSIAAELSLTVLPESARHIASMGFPLDENATIESQTAIWLKQMEFCYYARDTGYVSDRVFVDSLAYMSVIAQESKEPLQLKFVDFAVGVVSPMMKDHFDIVLYTPIEFELVDDGLRSTDADYQKRLDQLNRDIHMRAGVELIEVSGSKSDRLEQALKAIS